MSADIGEIFSLVTIVKGVLDRPTNSKIAVDEV